MYNVISMWHFWSFFSRFTSLTISTTTHFFSLFLSIHERQTSFSVFFTASEYEMTNFLMSLWRWRKEFLILFTHFTSWVRYKCNARVCERESMWVCIILVHGWFFHHISFMVHLARREFIALPSFFSTFAHSQREEGHYKMISKIGMRMNFFVIRNKSRVGYF